MKLYMTLAFSTVPNKYVLWRGRPKWVDAIEDFSGVENFLLLTEQEIRACNCNKKLPTGKQVLVVNLTLR